MEAVPQAADCVSKDCVYQRNVKLNALVLYDLLAERENHDEVGVAIIPALSFLSWQRMVLRCLFRMASGQQLFTWTIDLAGVYQAKHSSHLYEPVLRWLPYHAIRDPEPKPCWEWSSWRPGRYFMKTWFDATWQITRWTTASTLSMRMCSRHMVLLLKVL